ncbi:hypothetical protein Q5424_16050 [Conexibacter sp. JD483]|uniref:hypothetical protein n=1 Tax=unclassified Conexibacter TaxID=2627773 RepID=UPI00271DCFD6|nr:MULTISPECIES: hypothetical protein [unclassified Conexibacter]MDO8186648.1 hypothetical protein [Conexibacter sp. CPCC 205706]MDO8200368.1 hypothetical protein [Conexibacter sp. CPCC 205762]MDR9370610.1 hypothetical protein [Conexibacter sp. JD483]
MEVKKLDESSTAVALVAFLLVPYPLTFVANLLAWPRGVQIALVCSAAAVLIGTKLGMVVVGRHRSRRPG